MKARHSWVSVTAMMLVFALSVAGCGKEEGKQPGAGGERRMANYFSEHPYALTCGRVLAIDQSKAKDFHIAALSLAREVRLRGVNRNQRWARFVYALLDLCKAARDPAYRPAAEAVRLVRRGRYVVRGTQVP
jgi:hypothetical protein